MASSRNETQITWSSASSVTVSSSTVVWSDAFLFDVEDWEAEVQVNANNAGTPATRDVRFDLRGNVAVDLAIRVRAEHFHHAAAGDAGDGASLRIVGLHVAPPVN